MLPPRWVRRLVLAPVMLVVAVAVIVTLPVTAPVAVLFSLLIRDTRLRAARVLVIAVVHLLMEAVALVLLFAVWVGTGFGWKMRHPRVQRFHYVLVGLYLKIMFRAAEIVLHVRVESEGPDPTEYLDRPLLVFCRHAGPGDSFLLVHALTWWYAREPRIVLKDTLQWDPAIDVVLNRLPSRFIGTYRPGDPDREAQIGELAHRLDHNDALVLFPEGGNFTEHRRARRIDRLRRKGLMGEAEKAEAMRHVLAPQPGGVLAALDSADEADVVWVAHTGTDHLLSVADVWRAMPTDTVIKMRWWQVRPQDVPAGRDERITWLFDWWQAIDTWIAENRPPVARASGRG